MRTFIAIELDRIIKDTISTLIQKLDVGGAKVRWVKPQGMHLTLKFLGEISEEKVPEVQSVLGKLAQDYTSFQLTLRGTGAFPPAPRIPRIIWIGIEENEPLLDLQSRVENELHKIRFSKDKRKFHPHLTLGRVKNPQNILPVMNILDDHKQSGFGTMNVNRLTFFKSTLRPTGAEYSILSEFFLG